MTTEEWRPVVGFEGLYEVSSLGRVRGLERVIDTPSHPSQKTKTIPARILAQKINRPHGKGYARCMVALCSGGRQLTRNVARLVAEAFLDNPNGFDCVLHLDDDATNNQLSNLEWGDHAENVRQAVDRRRYRSGDQHHASVMTTEERQDAWVLLQRGVAVGRIAKQFNVSRQSISDLKAGRISGFPLITT
jgi:hypothetical protein